MNEPVDVSPKNLFLSLFIWMMAHMYNLMVITLFYIHQMELMKQT